MNGLGRSCSITIPYVKHRSRLCTSYPGLLGAEEHILVGSVDSCRLWRYGRAWTAGTVVNLQLRHNHGQARKVFDISIDQHVI